MTRVSRARTERWLSRLLTPLVLVCATLARARESYASGFYVTDRGVRPLGRGGAFVAGADDEHSIWYNPAGLAWGRPGVLLDGSLIFFDSRYTRQAAVDYGNGNASGTIDFPETRGNAAPFPVPTLVAMHNFGQRDWMFALGVFAPNAVITSYSADRFAPQRYSLITLDGSLLAIAGLWASYKPNEYFSFGIGVQALFGSFVSRLAMSGCPATVTCQPEDPEWDTIAQIKVGPIFAPSANAGFRIVPNRWVAFGLSGQLPTWVSAPATLGVRLPSAPYFNGAMVSGSAANVSFTLAPVLRVGVEFRPTLLDHIELAFVWEGWSMHNGIALTPVMDASQPNGIQITNVRGVGTYQVGATTIPRGFQDTWSIRLGLERDQPLGHSGVHFWPRVGASYETSATPVGYTSVLTLDADKFLFSIGASLGYKSLRIDLVYSHMVANSILLAPQDARLNQVAPFRANDPPSHAINAGRYDYDVNVFGLGVRGSF